MEVRAAIQRPKDGFLAGLPGSTIGAGQGRYRVEPIRVVTVTMPRMLSDIIARLVESRYPLRVVARLESRFDLAMRLPTLAPNLILIGLRAGETDAIAEAALVVVPTARIVAFSCDGRHAYVHELNADPAVLADVAPAALVDAILAPRGCELAGRV